MDLTSPANMLFQSAQSTVPLAIQSLAYGCLDSLSNEILFMILEYLLVDVQDRFSCERRCAPATLVSTYGTQMIEIVHYGAEPFLEGPGAKFVGLVSLASTSKRYRKMVQPLLFKAPILSIGRYGRWNDTSPLYLFARTLLEQPQLRNLTTSLRLDAPNCWGLSMEAFTPETSHVYRMAAALIDSLDWMSAPAKTGWKWQLERLRPLPFCALILTLLSNLKHLYLATQQKQIITENLFSDLFWSTSTQSFTDCEHNDALISLRKCSGLASLKHLRVFSLACMTQGPLSNITSLTSLDITLKNAFDSSSTVRLNRITSLRLNCGLSSMPEQGTRVYGVDTLYRAIEFVLPSFPHLEVLELYDTTEDGMQISARNGDEKPYQEHYKLLVKALIHVAYTLRKLELPRGWWTLPHFSATESAQQFTMCQLGANTGSIANFNIFIRLETLVIHSTAIIAKGLRDTEVADPTQTLPPSVKNITVYGAHDGIWPWIVNTLDHRGTHFAYLRSITLLSEEPVPGLKLSKLVELKESQEPLWEKLHTTNLRIRGDI